MASAGAPEEIPPASPAAPADAAVLAAPGPPPWRQLIILLAAAAAVGIVIAIIAGSSPPPPPVPELPEAELRALSHRPDLVARGRALWGNCVGCHGLQGQGVQGPNLRDDYWLHGSRMTDICRSIRDGYPQKGMPAWGAVGIVADDVHALAAYVVSLHGSEDGTGKKPEGVRAPIDY
jgi:mono/diheme cytochrome c family protein